MNEASNLKASHPQRQRNWTAANMMDLMPTLKPSMTSGHTNCDACLGACSYSRTQPQQMQQLKNAACPHSNPGTQTKTSKLAQTSSPNTTSSRKRILHTPPSINPPILLLTKLAVSIVYPILIFFHHSDRLTPTTTLAYNHVRTFMSLVTSK